MEPVPPLELEALTPLKLETMPSPFPSQSLEQILHQLEQPLPRES